MILTVTANVAIDRTYVIDRFEIGAVHKPRAVYALTGGKGVNVSRAAAALGAATKVTGLIGDDSLAQATRNLTEAGIDSALFAVDGPGRQTVTVTAAADGTTTAFDEPGPTVGAREWSAFEQHVAAELRDASIVVIAGSLPPGSPETSLAHLCEAANREGVPVILDARGTAMRLAMEQTPLVAKLNRGELEQTLGRELDREDDVIEGALELQAAGARHVVVTLGERGALGVGTEQIWRLTHPVAQGNPIGAGDAFSAALALALIGEQPFEQALVRGAAAALASLRAPTAGALDPQHFSDALTTVEIHATGKALAR